MRSLKAAVYSLAILGLASWTRTAAAQPKDAVRQLQIEPFDPDGIYDLSESAGWTVSAPNGGAGGTRFTYVVRRNNDAEISRGELSLNHGPQRIEVRLREPAMIFAEIRAVPAGNEAKATPLAPPRNLGAAISPTQLRPTVPRPDDFDDFWQTQIKALKRVDPNPRVLAKPSRVAGISYGVVTMDHVDGGHIHGQVAMPSRTGKFPGLVILQWASPPYPLDPAWIEYRAKAGWLTLNIEPHDVLPDQPASYYAALPERLKHYESIGHESRETSYFRKMYLADYRAVDYVVHHPQWDGKTLVVIGTSMGGQQGLCVAGLHSKVTHLIVNVPAGCDLNACLHGRQPGYPGFPCRNSAAMNAARYFDAVNFASRIHAKSLVAMGFVDTVCPPAGIWTAYNEIAGPKEVVPLVDSPHNHLATPAQQRPYEQRAAQWLDALVLGREPAIPARQP